MIQATEIRVGNFFEHNANWCYRSPAEIKPFKFQWEDRDWYALGECTMDLEDVFPIPLSPDILLLAGFKGNDIISRLKLNDGAENYVLECTAYWDMREPLQFSTRGDDFYIPNVQYLHQFQNLYFYFTGKELSINLSSLNPVT